jgi:transposase
MANPHPGELRERAVRAYESGEGTYFEIAQRFAIARRTLQRWTTRKRETGEVEPLVKGGGNPSPVDVAELQRVMALHPDAVTGELTVAYNTVVGRKRRVHRSSILRALHRLGYVFKKNGHGRRSRIVPTSKRSGDDS